MDGIDRTVISPSLINADWNITKFVHNPDFDLRVDVDFSPAALETAPTPMMNPGQVCGESQLDLTATTENPKKYLKLLLGRDREAVCSDVTDKPAWRKSLCQACQFPRNVKLMATNFWLLSLYLGQIMLYFTL